MADPGRSAPRTEAACAACGHAVTVHEQIPATFCMECGSTVLNLNDGKHLPPMVMPQHLEEGAWKALTDQMPDGGRARRRLSRLLFVPWHEWPPDTGRRRLVKDARALLSPGTSQALGLAAA